MRYFLSISIFVIFALINGQIDSLEEKHTIYRFNVGPFRPITVDEVIRFLNELDKKTKLRIKEENETKIYKKFLANRIKSSIVRDFLTMRYLIKDI
jgi:hypothetical protein